MWLWLIWQPSSVPLFMPCGICFRCCRRHLPAKLQVYTYRCKTLISVDSGVMLWPATLAAESASLWKGYWGGKVDLKIAFPWLLNLGTWRLDFSECRFVTWMGHHLLKEPTVRATVCQARVIQGIADAHCAYKWDKYIQVTHPVMKVNVKSPCGTFKFTYCWHSDS